MGRAALASACALIGLAAAGTAYARGGRCADSREVSAIQTAAIQQELMVAALTCNEIARFNAFQRGFGPELRAADATLKRMFTRIYGRRLGEARYHAFKTRLANDSSIRSIHDNPAYCHEAGEALSAALTPDKPSLASFAASVQVVERSPVDSCEVRVRVALHGAAGAAREEPRHSKSHRRRKHRKHK